MALHQVAQIESKKADAYLKSLAIEWLGIITSRIKVGCKQLSGEHSTLTPEWVYKLNKNLPIEVYRSLYISAHSFSRSTRIRLRQLLCCLSNAEINCQPLLKRRQRVIQYCR